MSQKELYYCTNSIELMFLLKYGLCDEAYNKINYEVNQLLKLFSQYININDSEEISVLYDNIYIHTSVSKSLDHYNKKRAGTYKYIINMYKLFFKNVDENTFLMFKNKYINLLPFLDDHMIYPIILKIDDKKYGIIREHIKLFSENSTLNNDILSRLEYSLSENIIIDQFKISILISNIVDDTKNLYSEVLLLDTRDDNLCNNYELKDL